MSFLFTDKSNWGESRPIKKERGDNLNKDKFYSFIGEDELYIYGDIVGGTEKWDESDTTFKDFKDKLDLMQENSTLNIYVNSGGGSVTATQGIIGLLNKAKRDKRIKTKCFIDGLAGSCASWLPMSCDEVYCYNTSLMMVHKPMVGFFLEMLNANDLRKNIEVLDKIEEAMLNAYESKLNNSTREDIQAMIDKETWLTSNEMCDLFNITLLEDCKELVAKVSDDVMKNYKNIPKTLKDSLDKKPKVDKAHEKLNREKLNNINKELDLIRKELEILAD